MPTSTNKAKLTDWPRMRKELERIWSLDFWEEEATRIEKEYWQLIKDKVPHVRPPKELHSTEHRQARLELGQEHGPPSRDQKLPSRH
jgi:hypothetical protein